LEGKTPQKIHAESMQLHDEWIEYYKANPQLPEAETQLQWLQEDKVYFEALSRRAEPTPTPNSTANPQQSPSPPTPPSSARYQARTRRVIVR